MSRTTPHHRLARRSAQASKNTPLAYLFGIARADTPLGAAAMRSPVPQMAPRGPRRAYEELCSAVTPPCGWVREMAACRKPKKNTKHPIVSTKETCTTPPGRQWPPKRCPWPPHQCWHRSPKQTEGGNKSNKKGRGVSKPSCEGLHDMGGALGLDFIPTCSQRLDASFLTPVVRPADAVPGQQMLAEFGSSSTEFNQS